MHCKNQRPQNRPSDHKDTPASLFGEVKHPGYDSNLARAAQLLHDLHFDEIGCSGDADGNSCDDNDLISC